MLVLFLKPNTLLGQFTVSIGAPISIHNLSQYVDIVSKRMPSQNVSKKTQGFSLERPLKASDGYVYLFPLAENPNIWIALFNYTKHMNYALVRPYLFHDTYRDISSSSSVHIHHKIILTDLELDYEQALFSNSKDVELALTLSQGYILSGKQLKEYWQSFDYAVNRIQGPEDMNQETQNFIEIEASLRSVLQQVVKKFPQASVVPIAIDSSFTNHLTHGISHALFSSSGAFKRAVQQFWHSNMSYEEREKFKDFLKNKWAFNSKNEPLAIDEFQAHHTSYEFELDPSTFPEESREWIQRLRTFLIKKFPEILKVSMPNPHNIQAFNQCEAYLFPKE